MARFVGLLGGGVAPFPELWNWEEREDLENKKCTHDNVNQPSPGLSPSGDS